MPRRISCESKKTGEITKKLKSGDCAKGSKKKVKIVKKRKVSRKKKK